jgi:hypothetical protein
MLVDIPVGARRHRLGAVTKVPGFISFRRLKTANLEGYWFARLDSKGGVMGRVKPGWSGHGLFSVQHEDIREVEG